MADKDKKEIDEEASAADENEETGEEGEGEEGEKKSGKLKLIIIVVVALLILGGGAAAFLLGDMGKGSDEKELTEEELAAQAPKIVYHEIDEFLVNLNNPGKQVSFLKMVVVLELPNLATQSVVESKLPRIRDTFQIYLRELRNTDLQGSAAIHRLREELLLRVNKVLDPDEVTDILFKEIIVQ